MTITSVAIPSVLHPSAGVNVPLSLTLRREPAPPAVAAPRRHRPSTHEDPSRRAPPPPSQPPRPIAPTFRLPRGRLMPLVLDAVAARPGLRAGLKAAHFLGARLAAPDNHVVTLIYERPLPPDWAAEARRRPPGTAARENATARERSRAALEGRRGGGRARATAPHVPPPRPGGVLVLQYQFFIVIQTNCKHFYSFVGSYIHSCGDSAAPRSSPDSS